MTEKAFDGSPAERMALQLIKIHTFKALATKAAEKHLAQQKTLHGENHWKEVIAYIELHGRI